MEAGLDVYLISNVANVAGNDIQFQNYVGENYRGEIKYISYIQFARLATHFTLSSYPFDNDTVINGYNTMLERGQTDVDADLDYILNMPPKVGEKVAGNKLQDNPVEATTFVPPINYSIFRLFFPSSDPLNNSTNTEQLNRSQKSDTPSTGENAPPVQHSASQRSGVDEDKPDAKGRGKVKVKGKGKAKAAAEPSASGKRRKRTNSTEIHPDVGVSKKRRVAPADFPMYVFFQHPLSDTDDDGFQACHGSGVVCLRSNIHIRIPRRCSSAGCRSDHSPSYVSESSYITQAA